MRNLLFALFLLSTLIACDLQDPEVGVFTEDVITLSLEKEDLLADSLDRVELTAQLQAQADANQTIVFTTEEGYFAGASSDNPDMFEIKSSSKKATATLVSSNLARDEIILSARVSSGDGAFIAEQRVNFVKAAPELMILKLDEGVINADRNDVTDLRVSLFRNTGVPSTNARIDFEVIELDTAEVEILPFVFAKNSNASVKVRSSNGLPGKVLIEGTVAGENGTIRDTVELELQ